jgi:hypothetical protein
MTFLSVAHTHSADRGIFTCAGGPVMLSSQWEPAQEATDTHPGSESVTLRSMYDKYYFD